MLSEKFYKKGNELLNRLKIDTKKVGNNEDIIKAKNFSAILKDGGKLNKLLVLIGIVIID